jgi:hypothetical protein
MNSLFAIRSLSDGLVIWLVSVAAIGALAQGAINFDANPWSNGTDYYERGMGFHVVLPWGGSSHDDMLVVPPNAGNNLPQNRTPYMIFYQQLNPYDYVVFNLTSGSAFGLTSVDLADPSAPSYSLLPITFVGFRADGSIVKQTFTTPGGGANSFLTYQFGPDFASGLLSVQIDAPRWAMDNLVWVPEPATWALLVIGVGMLSCVWFRSSKKQHR